ncbi:MAG: ATP-binding protein [Prolixibacteraceae bacterium]
MDILLDKHFQIIRDTSTDFTRSIANKIHWDERLIGIKGAKGTGKTTLLLQHIKSTLNNHKAIYLSLDDIYFFGNTLSDTVRQFIQMGYDHFFMDEVHKYPNWSVEIKNLYDTYRNIKIVFTGSSIIQLIEGSGDLSRRAMLYDLPGLSFREYIEFSTKTELATYSLKEILENHQTIANELLVKFRPFEHFNNYLQKGYYPFFIETPKTYHFRVENAINQTLESDLPLVKNISVDSIINLKKILFVIAQSVPFKPNIQKISERTGINRNSLIIYLRYLEEAKIIKQLYASNIGISALQKPQKIYFENPNLIYSLSAQFNQIGTVRETFVLNQLSSTYTTNYPKAGDFIVENRYTFEVGGKNKTQKQIANIENSYIISDQIEVGIGNKIPIWLLGFLY